MRYLIALTNLFFCLAAITVALFSVSSSESLMGKYPILLILEGKQLYLAAATIILLVIASILNTRKEIKSAETQIEIVLRPQGGLTQKATINEFKRELKETSVKLKNEAEAYFIAAELDFEDRRYQEAVDNYRKSINSLPTMSCYLNLGLALSYISNFGQAEDALKSGVKIAKKE